MRPPASLLLGLALLVACGSDDPIFVTTTLHLRLPSDESCRPPGAVDRVEVRALGDFAASDEHVEFLTTPSAAASMDRFPDTTRLVTIQAVILGEAWRAGGARPIQAALGDRDVLLLPFGRSCALGDPELTAPEGAAIAALPDGGLLVAGGVIDDGAGARVTTRRVVRLAPGAQISEIVGAGLANRRQGASATASGSLVVIAGGAPGDTGPADDTFEIFDASTRALRAGGALCPPDVAACTGRRDHGAGVLPDGRVLLVGGVAEAGAEPLASAVLIDPEQARVDVEVGGMPAGRSSPQVVVLDDGTTLIVGGIGRGGGAPPDVLWFDPAAQEIVDLAFRVYVPGAVAVPLPGARLALVGGDVSGEPPAFRVLQRVPPFLPGPPSLVAWDVPLGAAFEHLDAVRAAALPDGRMLVSGRDAGGAARAFVIDPADGSARETAAAAAPAALVALADGAIAELSPAGAALRRDVLVTPFDNPPATLLAGDVLGAALDAAAHVRIDEGRLVSVRADGLGARIDLPALRFAALSAELDARLEDGTSPGDAELLLVPDGAPPIAVRVGPADARVGLCDVPHEAGSPLRVERDGDVVRIDAGAGSRACRVPELPARVGLAVVAQNGTAIHALRVTRR